MASETKHLVSDILEIISDLRGETQTNTDSKRIRAISRANKDFAKRRFWSTHHLDDQEVVGDGGSNYVIGSAAYPMRLKGLFDVRVGGTGEDKRFDIVDINTYRARVAANASDRVCYVWFDAVNDAWKVHVNATPSASETIYYSYYWEPPKLTQASDSLVCPDPKIIARLSLGDIYEGEDEPDKSTDNKEQAEQLITELEGVDEAPGINQLIQMGAIENAGKSRGIGSY